MSILSIFETVAIFAANISDKDVKHDVAQVA